MTRGVGVSLVSGEQRTGLGSGTSFLDTPFWIRLSEYGGENVAKMRPKYGKWLGTGQAVPEKR
jgi:hypothetical protein